MNLSFAKSDLERLAQIVREETGNHVQEKNYPMLESRLRSHMMKKGLHSLEDYWSYFSQNERSEREVLQGLMTTHYTFFFREALHFEVMDQWIQRQLPALRQRYDQTKQPLRVWSAACSRGHEVYTLAMLLDAHFFKKFGIPFEIVGTDIDAESVTFGKNGVYPIKEVNTIPQMYLSGYWKKGTGPIKDFAAVHPNIKANTRFEVANLLDLGKWKEAQPFDIIFCRNVFIYFSEDKVKEIALNLANRLSSEGLLISGMSEPLRFQGWNLESIGPSCYVKTAGFNRTKLKQTVSVVPARATGSAPAPAQRVSTPSVAAANAAPIVEAGQKYKVLCVDDSPTIQLLIKKIFSQDPQCDGVDTAGNGREARKMLDAKKYSLITLDIHMPEVNGIEFLEGHYEKLQDPPVLMISSVNRTDKDLATKALSLGAFDYVEKPAMNNLQKSTDEILTKAKMALRAGNRAEAIEISQFDESISQRIIVPDASLCLRIVTAGPNSLALLKQVVHAQDSEFRSPPMLIVWQDETGGTNIEGELLKATQRKLMTLRGDKNYLRPNQIYIADANVGNGAMADLHAKSISLQILDKKVPSMPNLKKWKQVQVLLDESMGELKRAVEGQFGYSISDISPATSFCSISLEFFANIRKAAA